jgi:ClpP class serine protease
VPATTSLVAIVRVCGPLDHHKSSEFDSYDALIERFHVACESPAQHVVLVVDSPGGQVSGLFETAGKMRDLAASAGKTLTAYVEGTCCSAAYALACVAGRIVTSSTGIVGSIGVLDTRVDLTGNDAAQGVKVALITSGERKADGHPHLALTPEELTDRQRVVDQLASVFFEHVSAARGLSIDAITSLQARVYPGQAAVNAGLADQVATFNEMITGLTSPFTGVTMSAFNEARAALEKAAESDNEEEAKKAKHALAALSAEESDEEESKDEESEDEKDKPEAAEKKDDEPEASVSASTAGDLAAMVQALTAKVERLTTTHEAEARKTLLASRPDLGKDLLKYLSTKPLAEVKQLVSEMPRKGTNLAATAVVASTQGAANPGSTPTTETERMDQIMGVSAVSSTGVERTENTLILGAPKARKGA